MSDLPIEKLAHNIGGHAAGAIMNVHPFITATEIYWSLRGELPDNMNAESEQLRRGQMLEPVILDRYVQDTGVRIYRPKKRRLHKDHPEIWALPDGRVLKESAIVDAKAVHYSQRDKWGEPGTDQIPEYIAIQQQLYMLIYGVDRCDLPVWFTESDFQIYMVQADYDLQDLILNACLDFKEMCLTGTPPPPDYEHDYLAEAIKRRYPGTNGQMITLPAEFSPWFDIYEQSIELRGKYDKAAEVAKNHITMAMKDAAVAECEGRAVGWFTRRATKRRGYTVEPTTSLISRFTNTRPKGMKPE